MSSYHRKALVDVLHAGGTSREDLARAFDETEAAVDLQPLPRGTYRCRIVDGELTESRGGTPGYSLTFAVEEGDHRGRRLWHTLWLTPAAMAMAKRDLLKLGVRSLDMLERPLPPGFVCDVRVALRADDDGAERNRVQAFDVVELRADPSGDDDFASPLPGTEGGAA